MPPKTESPAVTRARLVEAMEWANYQEELWIASFHSDAYEHAEGWRIESARLRHAIAVHDREQMERETFDLGALVEHLKAERETKRTTKRKA